MSLIDEDEESSEPTGESSGVVVQFGLERRPVTSEVAGSSPVHPAILARKETPRRRGFSFVSNEDHTG